MRLASLALAFGCVALPGFTGCSTETVYHSAQQYQLNECRKIELRDERQRCIERAGGSYGDYKAEREATLKP